MYHRKPDHLPGIGLKIPRYFSTESSHPFGEIVWERRTAVIKHDDGSVHFEQPDVEVPASWSQQATNVVAHHYFRGAPGSPERENSVRGMIDRVAGTITQWGSSQGYFSSVDDATIFYQELVYLLVNQHFAFNSPVWYNVGVEEHPQCSACFINSVKDDMGSILDLVKTEGMLFKFGSGTGTNLSPLRSNKELLKGGGTPSGPVSFMRGYDAFAGIIKSGGKTRRAAKMVMLDDSHPDILEFIRCKAHEEQKAWALIEAGYNGDFRGEAYASVDFQNANNSVRASDDFMEAVERGSLWKTRPVCSTTPTESMPCYPARDLWREIARAAHLCGDPGLQFDTTINNWHTCPNTGDINASNPCSEYMFLDDTACNLASLNLRKFQKEDGSLDVPRLRAAVDIAVLAMEIIVDNAGYPTKVIADNSYAFRPLGLGYANLGAFLMYKGLPYDSDEGRAECGVITAIMGGRAYRRSAEIAKVVGPFAGFEANRGPFLRVMHMHRDSVTLLFPGGDDHADLTLEAFNDWQDAIMIGGTHGFRNAQATVLAPTGTIGFLMDCDTTGIEPDIALVKYKKLVGGGTIKIVNSMVPHALRTLGYTGKTGDLSDHGLDILKWVEKNDTIEGAPGLKPKHLPVFDCAFKPQNGTRSIHPMGHIKMMAAAQPFLSGAISKTVNLPASATVEDIENVYMESWKLGLKAVAVYRDGCKRSQPVSTGKAAKQETVHVPAEPTKRCKLPDTRPSLTHKFNIAGHEGYMHVGLYASGQPGEVFVKMAKEGSTVSGLMDSWATSISLALQFGAPLDVLASKMTGLRFEPYGYTENQEIPRCTSIMDYLGRWLVKRFVSYPEDNVEMVDTLEAANKDAMMQKSQELRQAANDIVKEVRRLDVADNKHNPETIVTQEMSRDDVARRMGSAIVKAGIVDTSAPTCQECGSIMVRSGACHRCLNCGATSGCS